MRRASLLLICLSALAVASQITIVKADSEAQDAVFEKPGYARLRILGVCELSTDSVRCWNSQGVDSEELADRMKARLLSQSSEIQLKFRMKNRVLVVQRQSDNNEPITFSQWRTPEGEYVNSMGSDSSFRGSTVEFLRYVTDPKETTASLIGEYRTKLGSGSLSLDPAVSTKVGTSSATFMAATKVESNGGQMSPWGYPARTGSFRLDYRLTEGRERSFSVEVFDKNKQRVMWVDQKGSPVADAVVQKEAIRQKIQLTAYYDFRLANFPYQRVQSLSSQSGDEQIGVFTNVDPKYIGSLLLNVFGSERVKFSGIPLK